jgi:predicted nuclease with TOPRIM domain
MMELMPPVEWDEIARRRDVEAVSLALRAEMSELRGEFGELRGEFGELRGEFGELRGRMDGLAARIALTNMATSMTIAGLVLAAVKLF